MTQRFSLAGLLRLRHLQQELAAADLAAARNRLDATNVRQERARVALGGSSADVTSTSALYAIAAGRAALRSTLADLNALHEGQQAEAMAAEVALGAARATSISLEKLEVKHTTRVEAEAVVAEQHVLDELASTSWHRDNERGDS
jgi:flagellar FliJ protein